MAVGFSNTNKPFNPRGNDQSPLAYNRAKLFSGKALDFDGVNDQITITDSAAVPSEFQSIGNNNAYTLCAYFKTTDTTTTTGWVRSSNTMFELRQQVGSGKVPFNFGVNGGKLTFGRNDTAGSTGNVYKNSGSVDVATDHYFFGVAVINDDNVKLYANGILDLEDTITTSTGDCSVGTTTSNFLIGCRSLDNGNFGDNFNGEISNAKIFNTALTAAQVADLYNNPEKVVPTGVDNTALKLWLPMQEGAGTTAINGAPDALGSEQIENGDFATDSNWTKGSGWTISGGTANATSASTGTPISQYIDTGKKYRVTYDVVSLSQGAFQVDLSYSGTALGQVVTTTGTFTDVITSINPALSIRVVGTTTGSIDNVSVKELTNFGTISGATWTHGIGAPVAQTAVINWNKASDGTNEVLIPQGLTSGRDLLGNLFENVRKQGALNLDGNSWAEVHDNESLDYSSEVTLETWIYWTGEDDKGILGRWHGPSNKRSLMLYSNTATKIVGIYSSNGTATAGFLTPSQNLAPGNWYHVAFTSDGSTIKIYIDGVEGNSASYSSGFYVSDENLEIATYQNDQAKAHNGPIAQPRIYNRALTAEEVQRNYNAGKNTYTN